MSLVLTWVLLAQTFQTLKVQPDQVILLSTTKPRVVSRILLHFPLDSLDPQRVVEARLEFTSPEGLPYHRRILLQVVPVTTPWDPSTVSWTVPWATPGGDFDATVSRYLALPAAGQRVQVDITLFVRNVHLYPGLLIKPPPFQGLGFGDVGRRLLEALKNSTLHLQMAPTEGSADTLIRTFPKE